MELEKKFQRAVFLLKIHKVKKEIRAENKGKKKKLLVKMHMVKRFINDICCMKIKNKEMISIIEKIRDNMVINRYNYEYFDFI